MMRGNQKYVGRGALVLREGIGGACVGRCNRDANVHLQNGMRHGEKMKEHKVRADRSRRYTVAGGHNVLCRTETWIVGVSCQLNKSQSQKTRQKEV